MTRENKALSLIASLILLFCQEAIGQMRQVHLEPGGTYRDIVKLSFYSPSEGYIASTDDSYPWVGYTSDSGRTISKRYITLNNVDFGYNYVNTLFGFFLSGVKAFNRDTLVVYGSYGFIPAILYSTNSGVSYSLVFYSSADPNQLGGGINDMVFPQDDNIGYAIDSDRILKTTNKGRSWFVIRTDPNSFFQFLEAVDNNNLITFSKELDASKLLKTSDGGSSWQSLTLPALTIHYSNFITANKGWLNVSDENDNNLMYYTSDGGKNWTQKNDAEASPVLLGKIKFVNDSTGFAMGGNFFTFKTTDSGKVWEPLPRDNNYSPYGYSAGDMQCLNENQLWSGGRDDFLELSTNGGGQPLPRALFKIDTTNLTPGGIVHLYNYSKPSYQFKWYVNNVLIGTSYNITYTHNFFSSVDSVVLIATSASHSDTLKKYHYFKVPNLPTVNSFLPATGSTGTFVTIKGLHFTGVTGVNFGGSAAASFNVESDTVITAVVASGSSGLVTVSNAFGGYSLPTFTYFPPPSSLPPVITSFSPTSGPVGTNITITGSNFGTSAVNNIVSFGAVKATVTTATSTQIICAVPAGASYEPISVLNKTTNLIAQSFKPFCVTFTDSSNFTSHSFLNSFNITYKPIRATKHVVAKDLDGDGKPDIATMVVGLSNHADSLVVYHNNSVIKNISFGPRLNVAPGTLYSSGYFDINDIDGDGLPDIVTSTNLNFVYVSRNTSVPGTISFEKPITVPTTSDGNQEVVITDLDNDGKNDIAVAGFSNNSIAVLKNTSVPGFVSFARSLQYTTTDNPVSMAAGDLDGDGKKDLVCYNDDITGLTSSFSYFQNTSAGSSMSFARVGEIAVPNHNGSMVIADYDGDGKLDVLAFSASYGYVFRNISSSNTILFASPVNIKTGDPGYYSMVSNLSGDAKPDMLVGSSSKGAFRLVRNMSTPGSVINDTLVENNGKPNPSVPDFLNAADFDLDGKMDVVTSSFTEGIVSVFRNRMGEPIPFSDGLACSGRRLGTTSDVTGATYQWQQNSGSGFVNINDDTVFSGTQASQFFIASVPVSWNGYLYRCVVDNNRYSSSFEMKVNSQLQPSSVSISTPATTVCAGFPVPFLATGADTSDMITYTWRVNGNIVGPNAPIFTTSTLTNGSQVKVNAYNTCASGSSAASNIITMTVVGEAPPVNISTPVTTICVGSNATFTATTVNGGSYQWQINGVNAGTNSNVFSTNTLKNNDQVKVLVTPPATSCGDIPAVTSNVLSMNVNNLLVPSVTISTSNTTICQGSGAMFVATPVNGGTNPAYQWQVNGVDVGATQSIYSTHALTNGSLVNVKMTSNYICVTTPNANSNTITMTVDSAVVAGIAISGNVTVDAGQSTSITSATVNGGSSPSYQWQDSTGSHTWRNISGATSASVNYRPAQTGDKLQCILTPTTGQCVLQATTTSNVLTFTVTTVTGIDPVLATDYNIRSFPNPANKTLFIDSLKLSDKWRTLEVLSIDGRNQIAPLNIFNRTSVNLDISFLPSGEFIGVLRKDDGSFAVLKFIKL